MYCCKPRQWKPIYTKYSKLEDRETTFGKFIWPCQLMQTPREMAEAGFFYKGKSDFVTCFHCSVVLHSWGILSSPKCAHYEANPDCKFIQMIHM